MIKNLQLHVFYLVAFCLTQIGIYLLSASPLSAQCDCPDVDRPGNTVTVSNVAQFQNAISQARNQNGNMTILVNPGIYHFDNTIVIQPNMSNLSIVGATGNMDDVFIEGNGPFANAPGNMILVQADNFSVANLKIGYCAGHAIQIQAEQDADNFTAINVHFVDVLTQMLKVSRVLNGPDPFSDDGRVLCCKFEFTNGIAFQNYTGGIDAHRSKNWLVQNNTFTGIRSPDGILAEFAIHFWRTSEGTMAIGNRIDNCDRGVGFGLTNVEDGHQGGLVMNNFIHTNRSTGIALENSPDSKVYNNTIVTDNYPRSIEYRFTSTNVEILNNLITGTVSDRGENDGAGGFIDNNYTISDLSMFSDPANYDYHLVGMPSGIVNAGLPLNEVTTDIDCDDRTDGAIDIGAHETGEPQEEDNDEDQDQHCELLVNTNFDQALQPEWDYWGCTGAAINGIASMTNLIPSTEIWEAALFTEGFAIEQGESYVLRFSVRASTNRTITINIGQNASPFLNYHSETINLTTSMQDFTTNFTMNEATDTFTSLYFMIGGNMADVFMDHASLIKVNCQPSTCQDELIIDQSISTDLYKAKKIFVTMAAEATNHLSASGEDIRFEAEEFVSIENISTAPNSIFEIEIVGCNE